MAVTTIDITQTTTLLAAYEQIDRVPSFLRDRYFPTNPMTDVFNSAKVLVDYEDAQGQKAAPFVAPYSGSSELARDWFHTSEFAPALLAPSTPMTIDDLMKRGFGEAIGSGMSAEERGLALALKDLEKLDKAITRREELMAAETMLTDGCVMTPKSGSAHVIKFHDSDNPYKYTVTTNWTEASAKIVGDIYAMIRMLTDRGLPAQDLVVAGDVAQDLLSNEEILKLLDIRNLHVGEIAPANLPAGATLIGTINVYGTLINLICYSAQYKNDEGTLTPIIPKGNVILTAPAAGRGLYGAVTQIEQTDGAFHTYANSRVPKAISDSTTNTRKLQLSAAPLFIPRFEGGWISCNVHGA